MVHCGGCDYRYMYIHVCTCVVSAATLFYCIAGNFRLVQNFAVFADRLASAKIKTAKIAASVISMAPRLPVRTGAAKIKTAKISSGALRGEILHPQKFPAIRYVK